MLLKRTTEDIIRIGQNLLEAKARLPHGQFIPWVKAELGISQPTAWRFMQVAQGKTIGKSFTVNDLISAPDRPGETTVMHHAHEGITYDPTRDGPPFGVEFMDWEEGKKHLGYFPTLESALAVRDVYVKLRWEAMSCRMQWEYAVARLPFNIDVVTNGVPEEVNLSGGAKLTPIGYIPRGIVG